MPISRPPISVIAAPVPVKEAGQSESGGDDIDESTTDEDETIGMAGGSCCITEVSELGGRV
ncbi:hypothetical protein CRG98_015650 [Punica granatum]|uniref:Uncharacterized protein n=1 Tax=Punica granatum TaxID=22663 RepID=A0A2I0K604_PUNGR|nr:hypothetical protein CRG98_015650 [Punica granatum]